MDNSCTVNNISIQYAARILKAAQKIAAAARSETTVITVSKSPVSNDLLAQRPDLVSGPYMWGLLVEPLVLAKPVQDAYRIKTKPRCVHPTEWIV